MAFANLPKTPRFSISQARTFWMGVLGFLKAIVWPVVLVLEAFKTLM